MTVEQQRQEIEFRLGKAEITLRKTVRNTLAIVYNKARARQAVLAAMQRCKVSDNAMQIALGLDYEELFDPSKNNIFFNCLRSIIVNNFAAFQNLFEGCSNQDVEKHLSALNMARRCPAHSYDEGSENWTSESFSQFRESMSWLEAILKNFN